MRHAVKHIRFVGIGPDGGGAPAVSCAALPLPPEKRRARG
jgi:hypothetical protein